MGGKSPESRAYFLRLNDRSALIVGGCILDASGDLSDFLDLQLN